MEEKKAKAGYSLRAISGFRNNFKSIFARSDKRNYFFLFLKQSKGFTLVEFLVVLGMIGILTTVALITIDPIGQLKNNRDSHRKLDLKSIQSALEIYRSVQNRYPAGTTLGSSIITVGNCPVSSPTSLTSDDTCTDPNATVFIKTIPKDPKTKLDYYYLLDDPPGGYTLYSCLESASDSGTLTSSTSPKKPTSGATVLGCSRYYGITNP